MHNRRICIVTGTRAEYGHLYWLMREIKADKALRLQLVVTGSHLLSRFGSTVKVIEKDGFRIDQRVNIFSRSAKEISVGEAVAGGISKFMKALKRLEPDIVVVLGDRYEVFSSAVAAYVLGIPIAHIHGGETTSGVIDEGFRHSITKMAHIHFPSTKFYAKRIIRMGEQPGKVFAFGAPGLDNIRRQRLLSKKQLEDNIGFKIRKHSALVTYHPVTLERDTAEFQINEIFKALDSFDLTVIFTMPNADENCSVIFDNIKRYVDMRRTRAKAFISLGTVRYLSLLKYVDLMIGNSSSGLIEAPSFKLPVINIGDRQGGRIRARNVIDCGYCCRNIRSSIKRALSPAFKNSLRDLASPYGDGNSSVKIKNKLKDIVLNKGLIKKEFFDG